MRRKSTLTFLGIVIFGLYLLHRSRKGKQACNIPEWIIVHGYMRSGSTYFAYKLTSLLAGSSCNKNIYLHEPTNPFYDKPWYSVTLEKSDLEESPPHSLASVNDANILASIALGRQWAYNTDKTTTYDWTSPFTIDIFEAFRDCSFLRLDALKWVSHAFNPKYHMLSRSPKVLKYLNCYPSIGISTHAERFKFWNPDQKSRLLDNIKNCVVERMPKLTYENLTEICRNNPIKVIKFVRGKLKDYIALAQKISQNKKGSSHVNSNLQPFKFIHLVRDPRAIIYSRIYLHWDTIEPLKLMSHRLCKLMAEDFKANYINRSKYARKAFTKLPDILLLKYEDLILHPQDIEVRVASFLGLDHYRSESWNRYASYFRPSEGQMMAVTLGLSVPRNEGTSTLREENFEPFRNDPQKHLNQWKTGLTSAQKSTINSECHEVLKFYRYV